MSLEEAEVVSRRLAPIIKKQIPKGWGFALIMFTTDGPFAEHSARRATYISDCQRDDVVKAIKEVAGKIKSGKDSV